MRMVPLAPIRTRTYPKKEDGIPLRVRYNPAQVLPVNSRSRAAAIATRVKTASRMRVAPTITTTAAPRIRTIPEKGSVGQGESHCQTRPAWTLNLVKRRFKKMAPPPQQSSPGGRSDDRAVEEDHEEDKDVVPSSAAKEVTSSALADKSGKKEEEVVSSSHSAKPPDENVANDNDGGDQTTISKETNNNDENVFP